MQSQPQKHRRTIRHSPSLPHWRAHRRSLEFDLRAKVVAREGLEPSKPLGRQIYSLLRLTASLPRQLCVVWNALRFDTYPRRKVRRWSWRRDLNPRPADYKSAALPTELRQPDKSWTIALPVPEAQTPIRSTTSAHSRAAPAHPQPSIVSPGGRPRRRRCLAAGTLPNPFKQNNSGRDRDVEALDMAAHRN